MPRRARLAIAGIPWHIIQRGNNRSACFYAESDYCVYLDTLLAHRDTAGRSIPVVFGAIRQLRADLLAIHRAKPCTSWHGQRSCGVSLVQLPDQCDGASFEVVAAASRLVGAWGDGLGARNGSVLISVCEPFDELTPLQ